MSLIAPRTDATLRALLLDLLVADGRLDRIASTSFVHPFQFAKIVLREFSDGSKLRLHCWHERQPYESPHNHGWDFWSVVLSGALENTHHTRTTNRPGNLDKSYLLYKTDLVRNDQHCHLEPVERDVRLSSAAPVIYTAGASYHQPCDALHSSQPLERWTVTLVHQAARSRSFNLLFKCPESPPALLQKHPPITGKELRATLTRMYNTLEPSMLDRDIYAQHDDSHNSLLPLPHP